MPYRKTRVYSGLNEKMLEQLLSTPASVVKPKVCGLNRTPNLLGDIYLFFLRFNFLSFCFSFGDLGMETLKTPSLYSALA